MYGFRCRRIQLCESHLTRTYTLVAMATKICDFQHKIGHTLACAAATSIHLHLLGDFPVQQFNAVSQTLLRRPCCHGNENLKIVTENSSQLHFCITDTSSILDQIAYRGRSGVSECTLTAQCNLPQTNRPCHHGNENFEI